MTYFPCFEAVKMTSDNLPSEVHILQIVCFDRIKGERTTLGH